MFRDHIFLDIEAIWLYFWNVPRNKYFLNPDYLCITFGTTLPFTCTDRLTVRFTVASNNEYAQIHHCLWQIEPFGTGSVMETKILICERRIKRPQIHLRLDFIRHFWILILDNCFLRCDQKITFIVLLGCNIP